MRCNSTDCLWYYVIINSVIFCKKKKNNDHDIFYENILEMFMKTMKKKENNWILQMSSLTNTWMK